MKWYKQQRLLFIETRLFWDGLWNRADSGNFFGISDPVSAHDIATYNEMSGNSFYSREAKTYLPVENFAPVISKCDSTEFFYHRLFTGFLGYQFPVVGKQIIDISVNILCNLYRAMRDNVAINISIQEGEWFYFSPEQIDTLAKNIKGFNHAKQKNDNIDLLEIVESKINIVRF